jgi:hypothetical protein
MLCVDARLERGARVQDPSTAKRFAAGEEARISSERLRRPRRGRSLRVLHPGHILNRVDQIALATAQPAR